MSYPVNWGTKSPDLAPTHPSQEILADPLDRDIKSLLIAKGSRGTLTWLNGDLIGQFVFQIFKAIGNAPFDPVDKA